MPRRSGFVLQRRGSSTHGATSLSAVMATGRPPTRPASRAATVLPLCRKCPFVDLVALKQRDRTRDMQQEPEDGRCPTLAPSQPPADGSPAPCRRAAAEAIAVRIPPNGAVELGPTGHRTAPGLGDEPCRASHGGWFARRPGAARGGPVRSTRRSRVVHPPPTRGGPPDPPAGARWPAVVHPAYPRWPTVVRRGPPVDAVLGAVVHPPTRGGPPGRPASARWPTAWSGAVHPPVQGGPPRRRSARRRGPPPTRDGPPGPARSTRGPGWSTRWRGAVRRGPAAGARWPAVVDPSYSRWPTWPAVAHRGSAWSTRRSRVVHPLARCGPAWSGRRCEVARRGPPGLPAVRNGPPMDPRRSHPRDRHSSMSWVLTVRCSRLCTSRTRCLRSPRNSAYPSEEQHHHGPWPHCLRL